MSTTGKVLVFLNLLGLIGLTYIAALLYGKTKQWSRAAYALKLYENGLPVDKAEADPQGTPLYENIGDATKAELFQGAGNPVVTQVEEVDRVRKLWDGKINAADNDTEKMKTLVQVLLPLARNNAERERLLAVRANLANADSLAELKKHLKESVRPAVELTALPDAKARRPFVEAYAEAVNDTRSDPGVTDKALAYRVEPKQPFEEALLRAFARDKTGDEMTKALDAAAQSVAAQAGKKGSEEAFLRAARGDRGKSFDKLFDECFDEALATVKADLEKRYNDYFDEAAKGARLGGGGKPLSAEERRVAISSLLLNAIEADPEYKAPDDPATDPAYKRVLAVVGIRMFNRALDRQAQLLAQATLDQDRAILTERETFVNNYRELVKVVRDRANDLAVDKARLADQEQKLAEAERLAKAQQARVKQYEKFVADHRADTGEKVKKLRDLTKALYDERIKARDATTAIQKQEAEIRELEAKFPKKGAAGQQ